MCAFELSLDSLHEAAERQLDGMGLSLAELEGRLSAALDESIMLSGQLQVASQQARDLAQDKERLENKVGIVRGPCLVSHTGQVLVNFPVALA